MPDPRSRRSVQAGLVVALAGAASAQTCDPAKLLVDDGPTGLYSGDRFGWSVAASGQIAAFGAPTDHVFVDETGSAYVFRHDGTGWVQEARLIASDGADEDVFGWSVAADGQTAVIGAWGDDDNGLQSGSAYVFRYDGTSWVQEAKLLPSDGAEGDAFGYRVAVSGQTAVIGTFLDDDNGFDSGSAYVFRYDGTNWVEEAKLVPNDGEAEDYFGASVAVHGQTAVIGAFRDDDNGNESGSAYIFRKVGGTGWMQEAKLLPGDGALGDWFGGSVAVSGQYTIIGSRWDDDNGSGSGSAYVFRHDGTDWVEEAKLLPSDGAEGDWFGARVAASGQDTVIAAWGDDANGTESGSAYVFRYDGTDWVEEAKLLPSDGAAEDYFSGSVALSGTTAVIGAFGDDDNGSLSGSAYVYEFDCTPDCLADVNGDGTLDPSDFTAWVFNYREGC